MKICKKIIKNFFYDSIIFEIFWIVKLDIDFT